MLLINLYVVRPAHLTNVVEAEQLRRSGAKTTSADVCTWGVRISRHANPPYERLGPSTLEKEKEKVQVRPMETAHAKNRENGSHEVRIMIT
jgi:hypothetical protein